LRLAAVVQVRRPNDRGGRDRTLRAWRTAGQLYLKTSLSPVVEKMTAMCPQRWPPNGWSRSQRTGTPDPEPSPTALRTNRRNRRKRPLDLRQREAPSSAGPVTNNSHRMNPASAVAMVAYRRFMHSANSPEPKTTASASARPGCVPVGCAWSASTVQSGPCARAGTFPID
jgi:hypothetical protein